MDKDRVQGAGKQAEGSVKERIGKLPGDEETEAEGKAEKATGKVRSAFGKDKAKARDALKKHQG